ncbi:MAG: methyltransferase domain-containing protein [Cyclobacteriaceae bacterium]|nr:methyltransferase domain-containing protein [Cyclobacteriaceae bacterium]
MKDDVRSFFNCTENYLHRRYGIRLRAEIIRNLLGDVQNKRILDAGCGDGSLSLPFLFENQIVFCDLAENMLELVQEKIPVNKLSSVSFFRGSIEDYVPDDVFDIVLCVGVLAHVPSVNRTIESISAMIKPGGKLILQFSDMRNQLTRWQIKLAKHGYRINQIYYDDLLKLCNEYGFKQKKEVRFNFLLPGMGRLPDDFLYKFQKRFMGCAILSPLCTDYLLLLEKVE